MEMKLFYRVSNIETNQGLWYDQSGEFTGLIHTKFSFCTNHELPMPFDSEIQGWLSTTDDLETLYQWFTKEDILRLQDHRYFIHIYTATEYKQYANHWVVDQKTSQVVGRYTLKPKLIVAHYNSLAEILF